MKLIDKTLGGSMNGFRRNFSLIFGCFFIILTSYVSALDYENFCVPGVPSRNDYCPKYSFKAEALLWKPCFDGFYAGNSVKIKDSLSSNEALNPKYVQDINAKYLDEEWSLGFRGIAGFQPSGSCCWDVQLSWTYFSPGSSSKSAKPLKDDEGNILETIHPFTTNCEFGGVFDALKKTNPLSDDLVFDHIKGSWDMELNVIDLELGRKFWVGSCFGLRPHFDLRMVSLDQKFKVVSKGQLFAKKVLISNFRAEEQFKNDFSGIGPRAGFDAQWDIGCGAGLFGNFAVALLYGDREASNEQIGRRFDSPVNGDFNDTQSKILTKVKNEETGKEELATETKDAELVSVLRKGNKRCIRPNLDLSIGAYWNVIFCGNYDVNFKLAWEQHHFFNQGVGDAAAGYTLSHKEEDSGLSTQGFTLSAGIVF